MSISTDGDSAYNRVSHLRRASKQSLVAPYSPECLEGDFCELRVDGVPGSPSVSVVLGLLLRSSGRSTISSMTMTELPSRLTLVFDGT